jgi:hypothetical protein
MLIYFSDGIKPLCLKYVFSMTLNKVNLPHLFCCNCLFFLVKLISEYGISYLNYMEVKIIVYNFPVSKSAPMVPDRRGVACCPTGDEPTQPNTSQPFLTREQHINNKLLHKN